MLPYAIYNIIAEYVTKNKLLDWVDESKLDWNRLSLNPAAIHLLEKNPDKINWWELSKNPAILGSTKDEIYLSLIKN